MRTHQPIGSEKDKIHCSFYYKIGACRHGALCTRKHVKPVHSRTVLVTNLYFYPKHDPGCAFSDDEVQEYFDIVYEDWFVECSTKYGRIEDLVFCGNIADHLLGNIYIKYARESDAKRCEEDLDGRLYAGREVVAELCPVQDFRESCCRDHDEGFCSRKGFCNFIHRIRPTRRLEDELYDEQQGCLPRPCSARPPR